MRMRKMRKYRNNTFKGLKIVDKSFLLPCYLCGQPVDRLRKRSLFRSFKQFVTRKLLLPSPVKGIGDIHHIDIRVKL